MLARFPTWWGRAPCQGAHNTVCERILKLAVLHRKNSLFYRSERGAVVGDIYMTLIHTAVLHGQNPLAYLTALMSHPRAVAGAPADWMPWNYREALAAPVVAPPAPSAPSDAAAAGAPAPEHATEPPTTAIPDVATTMPTTATATASPDAIDAQDLAAAPRTAPPLSQTANKTHAKPSSRSSRRQKLPLLPPPAFSLFTALPRAPP